MHSLGKNSGDDLDDNYIIQGAGICVIQKGEGCY